MGKECQSRGRSMDERILEPIGALAGNSGSNLDGRLDDATTLQKGKTYETRLRLLTNAMLDSTIRCSAGRC